MNKNLKKKQGFTLIEILVVIGIIAVLALIVLVAINPARQFAQARNTQRTSNVEAILNAIGQNMADNKGVFTCSTAINGLSVVNPVPSPLATTTPATGERICAGSSCSYTGPKIDLSCLAPTYIPTLPSDPSLASITWNSTNYDTGYQVFQDSNGRVTVFAPTGEPSVGNGTIQITR
jgi:type IV pilus assembly protein PilA